jgi:hypothetical protein
VQDLRPAVARRLVRFQDCFIRIWQADARVYQQIFIPQMGQQTSFTFGQPWIPWIPWRPWRSCAPCVFLDTLDTLDTLRILDALGIFIMTIRLAQDMETSEKVVPDGSLTFLVNCHAMVSFGIVLFRTFRKPQVYIMSCADQRHDSPWSSGRFSSLGMAGLQL